MTDHVADDVSRPVGPPERCPGAFRITKTELVWPGKYNDDGTPKEPPRVSLPFQVIERINENRATREAKSAPQVSLFDVWEGKEGNTFEEGWHNKLIWGDNLLVMGSLSEKFAGKIDLIYIDPPFATGADFSFTAPIGEGDQEITKDQSIIEEKAYRDTWGHGLDSYLEMLRARLLLMRDLLSETGSIFVHLDWHVSHVVKLLLDEVLGASCFMNEITWKRYAAHSLSTKRFDTVSDRMLYYSKNPDECFFELQYEELSPEELGRRFPHVERETGRRFQHVALEQSSNASSKGEERNIQGRRVTSKIGWRWTQETFDRRLAENPYLIYWTAEGRPRYKIYADEYKGRPLGDVWTDVPYLSAGDSERLGYATQKPEALLSRIVQAACPKGGLVADLFCGSGTTIAVAEKLGRRWIGCDLGRWAIHVTRKRLLSIPNCKPFEVLNLGKYERQYWHGVTFRGTKGQPHSEQALYEYLAFILKLYGAQPVAGTAHLHGKKGKAMVHIGAVDAPVTIDEINRALDECVKLRQSELHVLGWEWEMGLAGPNNDYRKGGLMHEEARRRGGIKLVLFQIPREVMEEQAVANGDVEFFELAYLDVEVKKPRKLTITVALKDFVIPNTELIPEDVREKVKKWSDYIDYWGIDWNFQNDTFMLGWVTYRTRKDRSLALASEPHTYEKPSRYRILVKVVDIFGNDTSQAYDVEVV
jgi:adenine-specific DNA-methyltransferase